jgi:hypothetical protein
MAMNPSVQHYFGDKERDWEGDFDKENGQYLNMCCRCNQLFVGYKRRMVCKACAAKPPEAT